MGRTTPMLKYCLAAGLLQLLFHIPQGAAQAVATAVRRDSINVFAAGAIGQTDYGPHGEGYLVGGDFTRHTHLADLSLDVRFNKIYGDEIAEKTFSGGIKAARTYGRLHPYLHFLAGYGVITFDQPTRNLDGTLYKYDDSIVYSVGGGVDYDLTRSFALKVDGQYQFWSLGQQATSVKLNPDLVAFGLVYRIPYQKLRPHRR